MNIIKLYWGNTMILSDAKEKQNLKVINILIKEKKLKNYIFSLGLIKNTSIKIIKKSILKGPIIIYLRNYYLALSNNIANQIEVDNS